MTTWPHLSKGDDLARGDLLGGNGAPIFIEIGADSWSVVVRSADAGSCPADLNGDGQVDGADLGLLLGNWGNPGLGDLDGSGIVDGGDLGVLLAAWGPC